MESPFFVNVNSILHTEDYSIMFEICFIKSAFTEHSDFEGKKKNTNLIYLSKHFALGTFKANT